MFIFDHLFLSMIHSAWALNDTTICSLGAMALVLIGLLAYSQYLLQKAQQQLQVKSTECQRYQTALQETEERLRLVIHNMPVMINAFDGDRNILVWNQECERVTGYTHSEIVNNRQCREFLYPDADYRQKMMADWAMGGNNYRDWEWETTCKDGSVKTIAWSNISDRYPIPGWVSWGIGVNITELKQEQALLATQNQILELIATGAELPQVLDAVATLIDKHSDQDQAKCAVLLMDRDDQTKLQAAAGTSIPDSQSAAICPCVSSCGTTTYEVKPVVVSDIAEKLPDADFGSCWSVPIANVNGDDLGTFAMYYPTSRQPSKHDQRLIDLCVYLAGIAIERQRSQEALQESYNILRNLIAGTSDAIFMKDLAGKYAIANPATAMATGKSIEEIIGYSDTDIFPREIAQRILAQDYSVISSRTPQTYEESLPVDGEMRTYLTVKTVCRDEQGKVIGLIGVSRDISDRQRAEQQIRELNQQLEQRVLERTAQLATANKELEAFSYSVSHDLRAPLRSVDGFSLTLLERYESLLDDKGKHYLHRIRAASQRMGQLIDDLLNLSRVTRSEMHYQTVDLSAIVTEIITDLQHSDPERTVEFSISPQVIVQGDGRLLRVVLENLLNNAWKFTSKTQHPRIEFGVSPTPPLPPSPVYFIRDNGAGFEMSYAHKLFGAFQRLHSTEEFPGTGIGLATTQRIIHRHGGEIFAEGTLNRGAVFYFTLPRQLSS